MNNKIITIILIFAFCGTSLLAQKKQEFSIWGAGGLSTLKYDTNVGDSKNGMGGAFGVGYNYYFSQNWSVGTGLELSLYNSKTTINELYDAYNTTDGTYNFEFRTTVSNFEEKQNTMFINIPIMAQFEIPAIGDNNFYASGGFKIGIPVSKKFKVTKMHMENRGYYPQFGGEIDEPEFMGFGSFDRRDKKGDLDLKIAYMVSLEAGMKWVLSENMSLYTGAYFDYGLNDISKDKNKRLVGYNRQAPEDFQHNSVLSSQYSTNGETKEIADKINLMSLGIKLKLAFDL